MICGIDEAGRGPLFGSLLVAGVCVDQENELITLGVRDSKKLSPKRREYLATQIRTIAKKVKVIEIAASDIDEMRKVMTLNEIEVNAFAKIVEELKPDICYVDSADVNDVRFGKTIFSKVSYRPDIISKHKADDLYPVVAAASIIAKTIRDEKVAQIATVLEKKLNLPLGSGYPSDVITQRFLHAWVDKYGSLPPYVRKSWKTASNALSNSKTKKLDSF